MMSAFFHFQPTLKIDTLTTEQSYIYIRLVLLKISKGRWAHIDLPPEKTTSKKPNLIRVKELLAV